MGKKRAVAAMTTPVFAFPVAADETGRPPHFSDYGFDPQLLCFSGLQVSLCPRQFLNRFSTFSQMLTGVFCAAFLA